MVSQNIPTSSPDVAGVNRGFVPETPEGQRAAAPSYLMEPEASRLTYGRYWAPVIAGTLLFYSISMLSGGLMFAVGVGTMRNGILSLGFGSAVWIVVTACIAYFCGGWGANAVGGRSDTGWLRGLGVWALSLPLLTVITAFICGSAGLFFGAGNTGHMTETMARAPVEAYQGTFFISYAAAWTFFIAAGCGLFASLAGAGLTPGRDMMTRVGRLSPSSDRA